MKMIPFLRRSIFVFILFTGTLSTNQKAHAVSPELAGTLSVVPGLGQVVSGHALEGVTWFAASVGLYVQSNFYASNVGYKIWSYNLYDAYQGAGARGAAKHNVFQNYIAAFNPLNIMDPVGVGILGYGAYTASTSSTESNGPRNLPASAAFFSFVSLGEEGLFRGFLFPAFSDFFGSKWLGAITSSVLFSLSHLTNKSSFYHSSRGLGILFAGGMALCWETNNNNYDLRHSIFTHAWYDVIVDFSGKKSSGEAPDLTLGAKVTLPF